MLPAGALHNAPAEFVEEQMQNPVRPISASPALGRLARIGQTLHIDDILAEHPEEAIAHRAAARPRCAFP